MIGRMVFMVAAVLTLAGSAAAKETLVKDVAGFDAAMKAAKPGDGIVLADGEWRDAKLVVRGEGEENNPITVLAETPGKVVFVGTSSLRIGGKYLRVRDLLWKDCEAESELIAFRIDSKTPASNCRLQRCAVVGDRPAKGDRKWVSLYGSENIVEGCRFEGKQSAGTLLVVWLAENAPPNRHSIMSNFFGPRQKLGKNGGEIVRVGDSKTSMQVSKTSVDFNYFYQCDGEAEIISNKSCENTYVANTFVGCGGALTLRHGNRCKVMKNRFFGDGRKGTGGVRIIGEDHEVAYNLFHRLEGDGARAAVSIMNGIADSPLNGYFPVKRAIVGGNTWIDCKQCIALGLSDEDRKNQTVPPTDCLFSGNVALTRGRPIFVVHSSPTDGSHADNYFHGGPLGLDVVDGWEKPVMPPGFNLAELEFPQVDLEKDSRPLVVRRLFESESRADFSTRGPVWMRPGDDYLPAVLKAGAAKPAEK